MIIDAKWLYSLKIHFRFWAENILAVMISGFSYLSHAIAFKRNFRRNINNLNLINIKIGFEFVFLFAF